MESLPGSAAQENIPPGGFRLFAVCGIIRYKYTDILIDTMAHIG